MTDDVTTEVIAIFDAALATHMHTAFGPAWRSMCHQSAKISTLALKTLFPDLSVELKRVELIAMMEGSPRFVHIGWAEDPNRIDGKFPAHFATAVGTGLYDPTFHQLRNVKTPLTLPDEPFFYAARFLTDAPIDRDGVRWAVWPKGAARLRIGYKVHSELHADLPAGLLISDRKAQAHAAEVVRQVKPLL